MNKDDRYNLDTLPNRECMTCLNLSDDGKCSDTNVVVSNSIIRDPHGKCISHSDYQPYISHNSYQECIA